MAENGEYNRDDDEEQIDDEEIDETGYKTVKDAVLFAIDISKSMLQKPEPSDDKKASRDSAAQAALKCAYQLMQQRIISNPSDMMGVLLFGTDKSRFTDSNDGSSPYPHCYLLTDLDVPYASDVKRVRSLVEDDVEFQKLVKPSSEPVAMSNVLFCANQIFSTKAPNFSSRRLFVVTDNDDPHRDNKELKNASVVRAKDLFDLGVTIELFPISQGGREFDTSKFYDDIVYNQSTDPEAPSSAVKGPKMASAGDGIDLLTSLLLSIHSKIVPKRTLFSNLAFELAPSLRISVKGYILFKRQEPQKTSYVYLDGETPVLATGKQAQPQEAPPSSSSASRPPPDVRRAYKFGGEFVLFKPEEMKEATNFGEPIIRLLGFKPAQALPIWAHLRPSTFIYPSEEDYVGSTRTFAALQQTMIDKKKIGIIWYIPRRNATPVLAALLPGEEHLGAHGEQVLPPGLWICQLPFADDIRAPPELADKVIASDNLVDKMRPVVQNLKLPGGTYDPLRYPNPALQWHYRILQALALEEDMPEAAEDKTTPRYRQIDKRVGPMVIEWGHTLQAEFNEWSERNRDKRPSAPLGDPRAPKRTKAQAPTPDGSKVNENMQALYRRNKINTATLPVLKAYLDFNGLSHAGKKQDLVERVEEHLDRKPSGGAQ